MVIDNILALGIGTLCLLAVIGVAIIIQGRTNARLRDEVVRLQTFFVEQAKMTDTRHRYLEDTIRESQSRVRHEITQAQVTSSQQLHDMNNRLGLTLSEHQTKFERRHGETTKSIQNALAAGYRALQQQMLDNLSRNSQELTARFDGLTTATDTKLQEISGQVERRLSEGFEKTTATFADVVKRLALIDEAQKKITELSSNVVSLQEVLSDKRSRGAFGEVQLNALIRNIIPPGHFRVQHTLSNGRIADCVLFLPQPTGTIAIDAKFPKEAYDRLCDVSRSEIERKAAEKQFRIDVRKHIHDISSKYIISGETSEGAVMFIPAEAIFAEIHAHHPEIVSEAFAARVWLVSPTTLMAILNTARAVLKDEATRKQVHVIQMHLGLLAKDFDRFQARMESLSKHIRQANDDVEKVHISAGKISARFEKIERVEIESPAINLAHRSTGNDTPT